MTDFEGLFALFTLLFGLIIAELALKLADAIDSRADRPMGILTPALAFLVLTDVTSFWLFTWAARNALKVNWHTVFAGVLLAIIYFLAASLVFPRTTRGWTHLDEHYWSRKRLVAGGMLLANVAIVAAMLTRATPAWNDWWFYFYFVGYLVALAGLTLSQWRRFDYVFLTWAIAINLIAGSEIAPNSHWGEQIGLAFAASNETVP